VFDLSEVSYGFALFFSVLYTMFDLLVMSLFVQLLEAFSYVPFVKFYFLIGFEYFKRPKLSVAFSSV